MAAPTGCPSDLARYPLAGTRQPFFLTLPQLNQQVPCLHCPASTPVCEAVVVLLGTVQVAPVQVAPVLSTATTCWTGTGLGRAGLGSRRLLMALQARLKSLMRRQQPPITLRQRSVSAAAPYHDKR